MATSCVQKQAQADEPEVDNKTEMLVGTYTGAGSEGIYMLSFDPAEGTLSNKRLAATVKNPSFLTISADNRYVYSVGETDSGVVAAFGWESGSDSLKVINKVSAQGAAPCYIDYSSKQNMVAVANYVSGNVGFYGVKSDGSLMDEPVIFHHEGAGPNKNRQESPHAHCSIFSKDDRFVYVVDLGIDEVKVYPVGDTVGAGSTALKLHPGDGPRHMVFHPDKDFAFIVNELSNTVVSASVNKETGELTMIDRAGTVPEDFKEHSQCADIHISKDGKHLYASNRGHHSIAIFNVAEDASLERVGVESVRGDWPRNFTLSPDERFLIVANERSDNIVVFKRDQQTGLLTFTGNEVSLSKPVCLKFEN